MLLKTNPKLSITLPEDSSADAGLCSADIASVSAIGTNWFLTLRDENLAQDIAWWLRSQSLGVSSRKEVIVVITTTKYCVVACCCIFVLMFS